ncbi:MAG: Glycosyltransferases involved in cell wall biogenesis, partial [uncultured Nocardioides sp.]
ERPGRCRSRAEEHRGAQRLRHRLAVEQDRGQRAAATRGDRRTAGEERGRVDAVRAAAAPARVRPRAAGRQHVHRRDRRDRTDGRGVSRPGREIHPAALPLRGGARRCRAPGRARAERPLPGLLLQLVLLPRPHALLVEVGRRHGAHHRGRGVDGRPLLAGRGGRRRHPLPAARALPRVRDPRLPRPRAAQHRGVGLPDDARLRLLQGAGVGDPDDAQRDPPVRPPAGAGGGAEVPARRRVRPLDRPRVVRHQRPQPSQAPRVAGLQRPERRRGPRGCRRDQRPRRRARRRPRHPHLAAPRPPTLRRRRPGPREAAPARL